MTLPSLLVTDTNIWIDLENGKILADIFRLPYQFFTTDFSVQEFIHPGWDVLRTLGLQTHGLEPESVLELAQLRLTYHQLSAVDLAALLLAKMLGACLVTGDRHLYELAIAQGLPVHGVLWILDEMVNHQVLTAIQAATALRKMLDQGARLPNVECQKRFERWS
jgi:predicted nucleic acid-binding protein